MTTQWVNPSDETCGIILTKKDGTKNVLLVGNFITFEGRPDGVKITGFTSKNFKSNPDIGPIGMTYLPWRKEEKRLATPLFTMKGDPRHIICSPVGLHHFGENIDWESVRIIPNPENN